MSDDDAGRNGARGSADASRRLKIACPVHAADLGGVERAALRLCAEWASYADVTVVLGRRTGWPSGVAPYTVDCQEARWFPRAALETPWMVWRLIRAVLRERPDVIVCPGNTYASAVAIVRLLLGRRCPPIVAKVSNSLTRPDLPRPVRWLYHLWCRVQGRMFDQVVAMSPAAADEVAQHMRLPRALVAVIDSPALDADLYRRLADLPLPEPRETGRRLLAIGRLSAQKNMALLIDAFARSDRTDRDTLAIAGAGPQEAMLRRRIAAHGLNSAVTLLGHRDDVAALLGDADALVVSSDYEGVPAVVIEALAAARPVIATDCAPSMRELLADGRRGVLVPRGDAERLGAAIAGLDVAAFDPDEARVFAARFTSGGVAQRYLAVCRALVARTAAVSSPAITGVLRV